MWLSQEYIAGYASRGALLDLTDALAGDRSPGREGRRLLPGRHQDGRLPGQGLWPALDQPAGRPVLQPRAVRRRRDRLSRTTPGTGRSSRETAEGADRRTTSTASPPTAGRPSTCSSGRPAARSSPPTSPDLTDRLARGDRGRGVLQEPHLQPGLLPDRGRPSPSRASARCSRPARSRCSWAAPPTRSSRRRRGHRRRRVGRAEGPRTRTTVRLDRRRPSSTRKVHEPGARRQGACRADRRASTTGRSSRRDRISRPPRRSRRASPRSGRRRRPARSTRSSRRPRTCAAFNVVPRQPGVGRPVLDASSRIRSTTTRARQPTSRRRPARSWRRSCADRPECVGGGAELDRRRRPPTAERGMPCSSGTRTPSCATSSWRSAIVGVMVLTYRGLRAARGSPRAATGFALILPWFLGFLIWNLFPVVASLYLSLTDYNVLQAPNLVGLANYQQLLGERPRVLAVAPADHGLLGHHRAARPGRSLCSRRPAQPGRARRRPVADALLPAGHPARLRHGPALAPDAAADPIAAW